MKKLIPLIALLVLSLASAQEIADIAIYPGYERTECNVSNTFVEKIKDSINEQMNLSPYSFSNLTSSYCYNNHVSLQFLFKETDSSITGKSISISLYASDVFDYDQVFTIQEQNTLDYTLKQEYISYVINGTNKEYYVSLNPSYDDDYKAKCSDLRDFYETISGEKYFNEDRGYCNIIIKTSTSGLKSLVNENINYISYLGDEIYFNFNGYTEGSYDLSALAQSLDCELSKSDYYYPEFETDCFGIYKDKIRVYFSTHSNGFYLNFYGFNNGKARLSVNAYGEELNKDEIQEWVNQVLATYLPGQSIDVSEIEDNNNWKSTYTTKIISNFNFNTDLLSDFDQVKYETETTYTKGNTSVTISEPYIRINIPTTSSDELMPYYSNKGFIITSSKIYSSTILEENNQALAVEQIKEMINPYINTGEWVLNLTVNSGYYPMPLLEGGVARDEAVSQGVNDAFSQEFPDFEELEEPEESPSLIQTIVNFFKGLFGI